MMKNSIVIILMLLLGGCSVAGSLQRQAAKVRLEHVGRKTSEHVPITVRTPQVLVEEPSAFIIPATVSEEDGQSMGTIEIEQITVIAPSRTLSERLSAVNMDFMVTLPRKLQGKCRSIILIPMLHNGTQKKALPPLIVRGVYFDKVQRRDYWQFERYCHANSPESMQRNRAFRRFVRFPYVQDVRLDSVIAHNTADLSYHYRQAVPTLDVKKRLQITLEGRVVGLDGTSYTLPPSDTLQYNISSLLSFADTTAHYSVKDTLVYKQGVELLLSRRYKEATEILSAYRDRNTAIALLSLGDDAAALDILLQLPPDKYVLYLRAIAYARLKSYDAAADAYSEACAEDESLRYRMSLDPELNSIPKDR